MATSALPEQLSVHHSCLAHGLEPKLLVECVGEVVVAVGDGLAHPECMFGLQRQPPGCLVELVERDGLLGHLQGAAGVAVLQARVAGTLKQAEQGGA